jgi:hypothetical protein
MALTEKDQRSMFKLVSLPAGRQGVSCLDIGYSSFYFQISCFDTSIVSIKQYSLCPYTIRLPAPPSVGTGAVGRGFLAVT